MTLSRTLLLLALATCTSAFTSPKSTSRQLTHLHQAASNDNARRDLLVQSLLTVLTTATTTATATVGTSMPALADNTPEITSQIYLDIKAPTDPSPSRLVIGLYGKAAPSSTSKLTKLIASGDTGLPAFCKPRDTDRLLQKEQLEANKVYNSCIENESKGVTYEYGTVWRIIQDAVINVGSVSGKYISREFPMWEEQEYNNANIPIDFGTVSVTRGNESGFGFTIHTNPTPINDGTVIVVGRIVTPESIDIVKNRLNVAPVVTSSKVNYKALNGGDALRAAPSRSCAYGKGDLYCNEFKPLQKLAIVGTGAAGL